MMQQTTAEVIGVAKQWWLKVNRKPVRMNPLDGAAFPYMIKVQYVVDGITYIKRKWIHAGGHVPPLGSTLTVSYDSDKPKKVRIQ